MNKSILTRKLLRSISQLGTAGCFIAIAPLTVFSQTQAVTGFDDNGWNADDVRNASGTNITNSTTHAPAPGATSDPTAVAQQIDWLNKFTTFGNLGGVRFDPTANAGGKATLSTVNTATGFGVLGLVANSPSFGVTYVWSRDNDITPGISFRIGVQTSAYATAQSEFDVTRSGEADWDLVLVFDPTNNGNTTGTRPAASVIDLENGRFNLFPQAGNTHWTDTSGAEGDALGVGLEKSRTLAEWLADDYWGPILSASLITNTQFGMGSGNQGGLATLDWAEITFLNDGARIDFVDAARYTGAGADPATYGDAANWDGVTPSATQNLVVENSTTLEISGTQETRSLGILAGTTGLVLQAGSTLVLNPAENGTLSAAPDATLNVTGPGTLQASVIEAGGVINLATIVHLDGGDNAHPVRDGGPSATSRYGLVVLQGGVVNLQSGADVTMTNHTGVNGLKTLIRVGELSTIDAPGVLNIADGARLSAGSLHGSGSWSALHVGDWGGQGEVNQTGGAVEIFGAIVIGNEGGTGVYNFSGGTIDLLRPVDDNAALIIGRATNNRAADGTLNVSGGTLTLGAAGGATGNVAMVLGGLSDNVAAYANANGTVNQTGGVVRFENAILKFGRGTGTYNLDAGLFEIGGTNAITATPGGNYTFNLRGGILRVINSNLSTSIDINVVDNNPNPGAGFANVSTSTIDTNGFDAALSGALTGDGYLIKTGLGTLILSGANNLTGQAYVTGGAIRQTGGDSAINYFAVGSGAGLVGEFQMAGGSLHIAQALQVGDWGGDGTFTQTGGDVVVGGLGEGEGASFNIGNQGGEGVYDLSGGTFTIHQGFANLGRSTQADAAGDGVLNLSGDGLFHVGDLGDLIIGDRDGTGLHGNGVVNQTGGTLRVTGGGELWIGAYGNGEYNLIDGVLEIGGAALRSNYGNGGGTSVFNLGGGAITVIGSDLLTDVRAVLVENTVSTINTNGYNATFSNGLGGTGGFAKIGVGALALNGITDLSANSTVSGLLKIGSGVGKTGTLNLTAGLALEITNGVGRLQIGVDGGTGTANFTNGASFTVDDSAATSGWGTLDIGRGAGSTGLLNHSSGLVDMSGGALQIGYSGATGTYHLSGDAELFLGAGSSLFIGSGNGASGLLTIADDAVFSSDGQVFIGAGVGATGTITQTGGEATFTGTTVWFGTDSDETSGTPGTGIYNLSDGTLTFADVNNGVRFGAHANGGSGVFNQSGGTVTVTNTTLSIGAHGTYNHSGGVLEIGGASLTGSGAYNLGGGTVRVINSNLTASVHTTLVAATTSIIDTNGFDASFAGFTGPGNLVKTGTGVFTATHADIGGFVAEAGHSRFTEASSFEFITVHSDAAFSALDGLFLDGGPITLGFVNLSEYAFLTLGGNVDLNGTLVIDLVEPFSFTLGDTLHIFHYDNLGSIDLSSFAITGAPALGEGLYWDSTNLAIDGTLTVAAVPEPATFAALAGLGALAFAACRRRGREHARV